MRKYKNNIALNLENIISFFGNITNHFTGKIRIITLVLIIIMLSFTNITLSLSDTFYNSNVSALSYQTSTNIGFTFLPTLNVSLSSNNLTINNLVPGGNAESSNVVTVNVSTNIVEGYNLYATVGNSTNATTDLTNTSNDDYAFTPLSSNVPNLSSFTNNNWGYSYSLDSGTTWISGDYDNASTGYDGLPLYTNTGIKLVEEADNTSSTVDFKIAAKASSAQPSGEYTNVINFTVVSNTIPTTMLDAFIASGAEMYNGYFKMQDMTPTICKSIDTDGEKGMQLIDVRDDKVYWAAKLKDNNCWMTQNLDLDLSSNVALTSDDTNISTDTSLYVQNSSDGPYALDSGYTISTVDGKTIISWTPERSTYTSTSAPGSANWAGNTGDNSTSGYYHPYSWNRIDSNGGPVYPDSIVTEAVAGNHAQSGNYYNWSAAVASNDSLKASGDQKNSICSKGWRLPVNGEYGTLYATYKTTSHNNNAFGLMASPLWFVRSGSISGEGQLNYSNSSSNYWSNTIDDNKYSYYLYFVNSSVNPARSYNRFLGFSVRCVVSSQ